MKIKWKIVLALNLLLVSIIVLINFTVYSKISELVETDTLNDLTNYSTLGISLFDSYSPGEWRLEGEKLYKGDTLINDNAKLLDEFSKDTGILATFFAGDTRVATTVKDENENPMTGTKASEKVVTAVISNMENYLGTAEVTGKSADTYYVPLLDEKGSVVGMWAVGTYTDVKKAEIQDAMKSMFLFMFIFMLIGVIISYLIGSYTVKAYLILRQYLSRLERGDFNVQLKATSLARKDEIGDIIRSFSNMQEKLKSIITSIKEEALHISESSALLAERAKEVHQDVADISATTEELSAGMEETAASSEEMNATSAEIEEEISHVSNKAANGQKLATEIKLRAESLQKIALESEKSAKEIYEDANQKLRNSLEKAAAIDQIKVLSQTILGIAAQTNLLALNASIESARAGEAGKGFAVVANEISNLARNSRNAASQIEEISSEISSAVGDIVADSKEILDFVDTKVIKDYDVLVNTSDQYHEDANTIEQVVTEIMNSATHLNQSISYIRKAVEEITLSTDEGSKGSSDIADKSGSIFQKTNEFLDTANKNKDIADMLNQMVQFFQ